MSKPSPIFCNHANEVPRTLPCDCPETCYCKVGRDAGGSGMCSDHGPECRCWRCFVRRPVPECIRCQQLAENLREEQARVVRAVEQAAMTDEQVVLARRARDIAIEAGDRAVAELVQLRAQLADTQRRLAELEPKPEPRAERYSLLEIE